MKMIERARRGGAIPKCRCWRDFRLRDSRGFGYERPMRKRYHPGSPLCQESALKNATKCGPIQTFNKIFDHSHCLDHCYLASIRSSQGREMTWKLELLQPFQELKILVEALKMGKSICVLEKSTIQDRLVAEVVFWLKVARESHVRAKASVAVLAK